MQKISNISDYSLKGRHTTKQAKLIALSDGGYVIDTPGIREFGLWDMEANSLKNHFVEINRYSDECKFDNCLHINEPKCRVKEAVCNGEIAQFRYDNYIKLKNDS
jgi:ribosome biogenesis GTPase